MRKQLIISVIILGLFAGLEVSAQVKIGDNPQIIDAASILELESTERVLVVTRVDSLQMATIVPSAGALVYNTSAGCVFYYDGTAWINLCAGGGGAIGEIPQNSIDSDNIIDGGINGVDIQNGSIGRGKLQDNSVDQSALAENSVGPFAIDNDNIDLSDFNNTTGFIRDTDLAPLEALVAANTDAIAADGDTESDNEIQQLSFDPETRQIALSLGGGTVTLPAGAAEVDGEIDNELITASVVNGTILTITEGGNTFDIDLAGLEGLGATGDDDQTAAEVPVTLVPDNYTAATQDVEAHLAGIDATLGTIGGGGGGGVVGENQDLGPAVLDENNILTINIENGAATTVDLSPLAGDGGGVGTTEVVDGTTLDGAGTEEDPFTIAPGEDGQFLSTDADGEVVWAAAPTGEGTEGALTAVNVNESTFLGNGTAENELSVAEDGIVTEMIEDGAVTTDKIANGTILLEDFSPMGAEDGQVLKWSEEEEAWGVAVDAVGAGDAADGSETVIDSENSSLVVTGTGTTAEPYILTMTAGDALDLNEGEFDVIFDSSTINLNESGQLQIPENGVTTDQIAQGAIGLADLNQMGAENGQILKWNQENEGWETAADNTGDANFTAGDALDLNEGEFDVIFDSNTINLNESGQLQIPENGVTTDQIAQGTIGLADLNQMGAENGQILKWNQENEGWETATDNTGDANFTAGDALNLDNEGEFDVIFDNSTINLNESDQLQIPENGVTTDQIGPGEVQTDDIANSNITPIKIQAGNDGQVLSTNGTVVEWGAPENLGSNDLILTGTRSVNLNENDLLFSGSGSIGIGTLPDDELVKLRVNGQIRGSTFRSGDGGVSLPAYRFESDLNSGMFLAAESELGFSTGGAEAIRIIGNGNVGIGIPAPTAKLHVDGDIIANQLITPDYVFQKYYDGKSDLNPSYKIMSLADIEEFTKSKRHLPGVPSAKDVENRGGILINRATEINLEKIEELYLHTIEQEKKINRLQSEKEALAHELQTLKDEVEEIKTMLKDKK